MDTEELLFNDVSVHSDDSIFKENLIPFKTPTKHDRLASLKNPITPSPLKTSYSVNSDIRRFLEADKYEPRFEINNRYNDRDNELEFDKEIQKTHKLISEIPNNNIQLELNNTIDKFNQRITELENELQRNQNQRKHQPKDIRPQEINKPKEQLKVINQLQDKIGSLELKNQILTKDLSSMKEDCIKYVNENNELKHSNELLRSKLIKYKNLYEKSKSTASKPTSKFTNDIKNTKLGNTENLIRMYNEMARLLNKDTKKHPDKSEEDEEEEEEDNVGRSSLLEEFQKIIEQKAKENEEDQVKEKQNAKVKEIKRHIKDKEENKELLNKIIEILTTNSAPGWQRIDPQGHPLQEYTPIEKGFQAPPISTEVRAQPIKQAGPTMTQGEPQEPQTSQSNIAASGSKQDVVLKCYLCCDHNHNGSIPTTTKKKCPRCSSVSSAAADPPLPTLDLMGEYKWSL